MQIEIAGREFEESDVVPWEVVEASGEFYFLRARHLGVGAPTAILFADEAKLADDERERYIRAFAAYHLAFQDGETKKVREIAEEERRRQMH